MTDMTTDEARRRRREERRKLRRDDSVLRDQKARARARIEATRAKMTDEDVRSHNAVVSALLPRIQGAVDSWCGKNVPMQVRFPATSFYAATDFHQIMLNIPADEVSVDFIGDLRGLAYHETGHIRLTVPFLDLLRMATSDTDQRASNAFTYYHRTFAVTREQLQFAWNILEDQRMETAMVRESRNLASYYNVIVLSHVVAYPATFDTSWLFLIGREHVDTDVCVASRQAMIDAHGLDAVIEAEALVDGYMAADNADDMLSNIVRFAQLRNRLNVSNMEGGIDGHDQSGDDDDDDGDSMDLDELQERLSKGITIRIRIDPTDAEDGSGAGEGEGEGDDDDDDDDAGNVSGDNDDAAPTPGSKAGTGKGSADSMHGEGELIEKIKEALRQAIEDRNADKTLTFDMRSFTEAMQSDQTPLPRLTPKRSNNPERITEAHKVNRMLRTIFDQARAEAAPTWQTGQRAGVLDVMRYKTRQPGDREFFRSYAGRDDMHKPNLAVSLILDGSGSMHSYDADLGQAAYACKTACDVFDLPCTVTVFDSSSWLLWDHSDRPLDMPVKFIPQGGTDPTAALDLMDRQVHDKDRHLVIIMTDGQWSGGWHLNGGKSLAHYQYPNRDIVLLFWQTAETNVNGLSTVAEHRRIDSLMEMPAILRRYILASF